MVEGGVVGACVPGMALGRLGRWDCASLLDLGLGWWKDEIPSPDGGWEHYRLSLFGTFLLPFFSLSDSWSGLPPALHRDSVVVSCGWIWWAFAGGELGFVTGVLWIASSRSFISLGFAVLILKIRVLIGSVRDYVYFGKVLSKFMDKAAA